MLFILLMALLIGVTAPPVLLLEQDAIELTVRPGFPGRRVGGGTRCVEVGHA